jgi:hypothetical protein
MYIYSDRVYCSQVADQILPGAYAHASGNGKYSVSKRQFYYAVRDQFRKQTGSPIDSKYFCQDLLVRYMNRHPEETAKWKVTADPRGTFVIPNAGHPVRIPCGTIQIDSHLAAHGGTQVDSFEDIPAKLDIHWRSLAAGQRYQAVVYIEKEGFEPLFEEARIAERFDIAILSCKGQSVVAARKLVDHVCRIGGGVPLFVIHDFDKYGFEISQSLTRVSEAARESDLIKYEFRNEINVTDLGLRLTDVQKYNLPSESFSFKGSFPHDSIATKEEREFLQSNRRVELNAFTSPQFIEWIEEKLQAHGLSKRLIPNDDVLEAAYRRAVALAKVNKALEAAKEEAVELAETIGIPKTLRLKLQLAMKDSPQAWDKALYAIAKTKVYEADKD